MAGVDSYIYIPVDSEAKLYCE